MFDLPGRRTRRKGLARSDVDWGRLGRRSCPHVCLFENRVLLASLGGDVLAAIAPKIELGTTQKGTLSAGEVVFFQIEPTIGGGLVAEVRADGALTRLSLLDGQGETLTQSDGQSPANRDQQIEEYVSAGTYFLEVQNLDGSGTYVLTTSLTPSAPPFQAIPITPVGAFPSALVTGDFTGDGHVDLAVANGGSNDVSILLRQWRRHLPAPGDLPGGQRPRRDRGGGLQRRRSHRPRRRQRWRQRRLGPAGQRRRHLPAPGHLRGGVRAQAPSWRATSTATAAPTSPSQTISTTTCRCCWAMATAPSRPRSPTRWGPRPGALVAGDFNGDGRTDLAVANFRRRRRVGAAGQRRRHLPAPGRPTRWVRALSPSWRATSTATAAPTSPPPTCLLQRRVGAAGQRRRHLPAPGRPTRWGPARTPSWRATSTATAGPTSPSPTATTTTCRCCWATATAPSRPRSPTRWVRARTPSWRATSTATAAPTSPSPTVATTTCRCCWATATAPSGLRSPTRWGSRQRPSWRATSTATAAPTSPSPTTTPTTVSVLLGNGDGTFQPQVTYAVGSSPQALVAGDFNGDGRTDLAVANYDSNDRVGAAGQRRRHLPAPGHLRGGVGPSRPRGGRLQRRRPPRPGRRQLRRQRRVGAAGQRRRHLPAPGHLRGGVEPVRARGGRLQRRRPPRPRRRQL